MIPHQPSWDSLIQFLAALRQAGIRADISRLAKAVRGLEHLAPAQVADLYWTLRICVSSKHTDIAIFNAVFDEWLGVHANTLEVLRTPGADHVPNNHKLATSGEPGAKATQLPLVERESTTLVEKFDGLADRADDLDEIEDLKALAFRLWPRRRSAHNPRDRAEQVDARRTLRTTVRNLGEPIRVHRRSDRASQRHILMFIDVSLSMRDCVGRSLRLAYALVQAMPNRTQIVLLGNRFAVATETLRTPDYADALLAIAPLLSGCGRGTRLGACLEAFLAEWGGRRSVRQAVAIIVSDGHEGGRPWFLIRAVERLSKLALHLVWLDPADSGSPTRRLRPPFWSQAEMFVANRVVGSDLTAIRAVLERASRLDRRLSVGSSHD